MWWFSHLVFNIQRIENVSLRQMKKKGEMLIRDGIPGEDERRRLSEDWRHRPGPT
jgi:hypothetical protein